MVVAHPNPLRDVPMGEQLPVLQPQPQVAANRNVTPGAFKGVHLATELAINR